MIRGRTLALVITAWALASPGLAQDDGDLLVSTAVSLKEPLVAAIEDFIARPLGHDGPAIRVHAGGSTVLAQQILRGAPSDLFLSASPHEIERLAAAGLVVENAKCTLAGNTLVVVVPVNGQSLDALHDLVDPRFERIGLANPRTAPLGRYTKQALEATNLQTRLEGRQILAEHARQVVDYVARGEVDAAILYATDAQRFADRVSIALEIDPDLHEPIAYQAVLLVDERPRYWAERLFEFLCSDTGRAWFVESGLRPWPGPR